VRTIDRLYKYLELKDLSAYAVEHACGLSNGYLNKQYRGKGSIGTDILAKISAYYQELSLLWLVSGEGPMLLQQNGKKGGATNLELQDEEKVYSTSRDEIIQLLKEKISILEATIADKDKIIALLEAGDQAIRDQETRKQQTKKRSKEEKK
jgi:transcriptional regulator with XRE-family HTH domain